MQRATASLLKLVLTVVVLAALALLAVLYVPGVAQSVYDRGARAKTAAANRAPLADDALRVAICGSSAPLPSAGRSAAASSPG